MSERIQAALRVAAESRGSAPACGRRFTRRLAMGDPQAPLARVLGVLDAHGVLDETGMLRPEVQLVSIGDHFDWGTPDRRVQAARDAVRLLNWLTAHPSDQVILIAGNHDLGRVGELAAFDDARFRAARDEADIIYDRQSAKSDPKREHDFLAAYPDVPTAELVARDFSTFEAGQRDYVVSLLDSGRLRLAFAAAPDLLLCHAGVTIDDLSSAGLPSSLHRNAFAAADALNRALDRNRSFDEWGGVVLPGLHIPGRAASGEGLGILYHRPGHPGYGDATLFERPWARRYDPRRLPIGLTQAIGHILDKKCRLLLREWADEASPAHGVLRCLETDGSFVRYRHGVPTTFTRDVATMLFIDGGMQHVSPHRYQLLDLDSRRPAVKSA